MGPGRPPLHRDRRRRRRRRPARERPGQGQPAGQAPSHQPAAQPEGQAQVRHPAGQPVRRRGRPERDLRARPAQPVPVLVRPQPDRDRRRRPGPLRGGQLQDARRQRKGANFGWDHYEGNARYEGGPLDNHAKPIFTYSHSGGRCSITGGYVVRDKDLGQRIRGRYVYGDLCTGEIRSIRASPGGASGQATAPASPRAASSRSAPTRARTSTSSRAAPCTASAAEAPSPRRSLR